MLIVALIRSDPTAVLLLTVSNARVSDNKVRETVSPRKPTRVGTEQ